MSDRRLASLTERMTQLRTRYDGLKASSERVNCESHWQQVAEVISPRKLDFVGLRTPGEKRMNRVYDPTGIHANEMLAAGLHGMATNPAAKWFSLRLIAGQQIDPATGESNDLNEEPSTARYLSHIEDVMWQRIYRPGSNFTTALHEVYLDLGSFGTAILFIGQRDNGELLFECVPLASVVIAENVDGRVDTVFRRTDYTVRQMMQMAEAEGWTVSDQVKDKYRNGKLDDPVTVIHVVLPRADREPGKKGTMNMPYASIYFEHETTHLLRESGFPEFPYLCPRWGKYAGEVYGRSPGMTALPDVKMLQSMMISVIKALEKANDPPMWLKDQGMVGAVRTVPGGVNYWRGGNPSDGVMFMPTQLTGMQYALQEMEAIRNRIRTIFFTDIMQFVTDAKMTATEVMARTQERMRLMGPLMGRLESELLGPMVERIFGILGRLGVLPPAPEHIQDMEFTVEYVSPIATAQRQQSAGGILQVYQLLAPLGPEIAAQLLMKRVNPDKLIAWAWDLFHCDPDLLNDEAEMTQAGQMQQAQQAMGLMQPMAEMAATGGRGVKDLAQAQASGGIDLGQLMGALAGQVQSNPRAMQELQALASGRQPEMPAGMPS